MAINLSGKVALISYRIKGFLVFILLGAIVGLQYSFDIQESERPITPPSIVPAQAIKLGDLGLHSFASAIMWVYFIQNLFEHPDKSSGLMKVVNDLDPKFSYPYAFSALVLPSFGLSKEAVEIAKSGIEKSDPDWRVPYYLATTYHMFFKDRKNAAIYLDVAAHTPGVPENIKWVAAQYGLSKTALEQTKEIWISIYETSKDELVLERAKSHIIQIEIIEVLEKAVSIFNQKYGSYPVNINDLVDKKIIKAIPPSPFGVEFYLGENGSVRVK